MTNLGLVPSDLNTRKTKADFQFDDERVSKLHFRYYVQKMTETVN